MRNGTDINFFYFFMGHWDPQDMILMGHGTLGKGPIIGVFIHWKFGKKDVSPGCRYLVADESLLSVNGLMQDAVISEFPMR